MKRPSHLPDYGSPPLHEVVLGLQFRPAEGYQQIRAGEVWALFKEEFPIVEEQPRLAPTFETFGPIQAPRNPSFEFVEGAEHDRFWFISSKRDELIQFQSDRLLHNWRKAKGVQTKYPRFEKMQRTIKTHAKKLEIYFNSLQKQRIEVTQIEVTYINHFQVESDEGFDKVGDYLNIVDFPSPPDDVVIRYRRTISDADGKPTGRLHVESNPALTGEGKRVIVCTLTVRGAPSDPSIDAAVSYLRLGRDMIVNEFTMITTDKAHRLWERKQ